MGSGGPNGSSSEAALEGRQHVVRSAEHAVFIGQGGPGWNMSLKMPVAVAAAPHEGDGPPDALLDRASSRDFTCANPAPPTTFFAEEQFQLQRVTEL